MTFPLLLNDTTKSKYAFPDGVISPYPIDVVVDKDGIIRYLRHEYDPEAMAQVIETALNE